MEQIIASSILNVSAICEINETIFESAIGSQIAAVKLYIIVITVSFKIGAIKIVITMITQTKKIAFLKIK